MEHTQAQIYYGFRHEILEGDTDKQTKDTVASKWTKTTLSILMILLLLNAMGNKRVWCVFIIWLNNRASKISQPVSSIQTNGGDTISKDTGVNVRSHFSTSASFFNRDLSHAVWGDFKYVILSCVPI